MRFLLDRTLGILELPHKLYKKETIARIVAGCHSWPYITCWHSHCARTHGFKTAATAISMLTTKATVTQAVSSSTHVHTHLWFTPSCVLPCELGLVQVQEQVRMQVQPDPRRVSAR